MIYSLNFELEFGCSGPNLLKLIFDLYCVFLNTQFIDNIKLKIYDFQWFIHWISIKSLWVSTPISRAAEMDLNWVFLYSFWWYFRMLKSEFQWVTIDIPTTWYILYLALTSLSPIAFFNIIYRFISCFDVVLLFSLPSTVFLTKIILNSLYCDMKTILIINLVYHRI